MTPSGLGRLAREGRPDPLSGQESWSLPLDEQGDALQRRRDGVERVVEGVGMMRCPLRRLGTAYGLPGAPDGAGTGLLVAVLGPASRASREAGRLGCLVGLPHGGGRLASVSADAAGLGAGVGLLGAQVARPVGQGASLDLCLGGRAQVVEHLSRGALGDEGETLGDGRSGVSPRLRFGSCACLPG